MSHEIVHFDIGLINENSLMQMCQVSDVISDVGIRTIRAYTLIFYPQLAKVSFSFLSILLNHIMKNEIKFPLRISSFIIQKLNSSHVFN